MSETENKIESQKRKISKLAMISLFFVVISLIILPFKLIVYRPKSIELSGLHIVCSIGLIALPLSLYTLLHIRKHKDKLKGKSFVFMSIIFTSCVFLWFLYEKFDIGDYALHCSVNISGLEKAMKLYAADLEQYLEPNKWCDLLVTDYFVSLKQFVCLSGTPVSYTLVYGKLKYTRPKPQRGSCNYAINPNCEPNSPNDTVLLFETKLGWNQNGGPEILTTENHQGVGCSIAFNDGHVEFIKTEELKDLKWK
jgi:hypothetical protein